MLVLTVTWFGIARRRFPGPPVMLLTTLKSDSSKPVANDVNSLH